nr:MAG TPA: hypothetical protein [Caudoviricetes sp.]
MGNFDTNVIKYIKQKSSSGFNQSPTYLGAEQRFVGALRNSGVNNLEEQYILGTDTYTERYIDSNGNRVEEISYHINDTQHSISDYYKVISIDYKDGVMNEDFYFSEHTLRLPADSGIAVFGTGTTPFLDRETLYGEDNVVFSFGEGNSLKIFPSTFTVIQKHELHYIKNNGATDVLVLTKIVGRRYIDDGKREVMRESIINHIK